MLVLARACSLESLSATAIVAAAAAEPACGDAASAEEDREVTEGPPSPRSAAEGERPRPSPQRRRGVSDSGHWEEVRAPAESDVLEDHCDEDWRASGSGLLELAPGAPGDTAAFALPQELFDRLLPHQRSGVAWMARLHKAGYGGILADEMGLGKTIQACAFLEGLHRGAAQACAEEAPGLRALVLLPATLLEQWRREACAWCPSCPVHAYCGTAAQRSRALRAVAEPAGGLLLAPHSLVAGSAGQLRWPGAAADPPTPAGGSRPSRPLMRRSKVMEVDGCDSDGSPPEPGNWDVVLCDEAHRVRNASTLLGQALRGLRSRCRILLSGTPVQNSLQDLWSLMDFAQPGLLGSQTTFSKHFADPIAQGSVRGADAFAAGLRRHLSEQLWQLVSPHLLRRTKLSVGLLSAPGPCGDPVATQAAGGGQEGAGRPLPSKLETVIWLMPAERQLTAYRAILDKIGIVRDAMSKARLGVDVFRAIGLLRQLCNHPALAEGSWREGSGRLGDILGDIKAPGALSDPTEQKWFYLDRTGQEYGPFLTEKMRAWFTMGHFPVGGELLVRLPEWTKHTPVKELYPGGQVFEGPPRVVLHSQAGQPNKDPEPGYAGDLLERADESPKLMCLAKLLPALRDRGRRALVFAQGPRMLDLVEAHILKRYELGYLRIDGQTATKSRDDIVRRFESETDRFAFMLLTTGVGGTGLNLTSADRVVIIDPAWNPATDAQAVDRAFRIGQTREVRVYRLIMSGLVEDKMFRLQVFKHGLTKAAFGEGQSRGYFTAREIRGLFDWTDPDQGETRRLLEDSRPGGDAAVVLAAKEDGAENAGWLEAGNVVALSNLSTLLSCSGEGNAASRSASCAMSEEIREKLKSADERAQWLTQRRQEAESHLEAATRAFEEATEGTVKAQGLRATAESTLEERRASLAKARRVLGAAESRAAAALSHKEQIAAGDALQRAREQARQSFADAERSLSGALHSVEGFLAAFDEEGNSADRTVAAAAVGLAVCRQGLADAARARAVALSEQAAAGRAADSGAAAGAAALGGGGSSSSSSSSRAAPPREPSDGGGGGGADGQPDRAPPRALQEATASARDGSLRALLALCDAGQAFARSLRRLGGGGGDPRQEAVDMFDALRQASLGADELWRAWAATLETERGALEVRSALQRAERARADAVEEVAIRARAREAREAAAAEAEAFLRSAEESEERRARLRDQLKAAFGGAYLEVLRLRAEEEASASNLASLREWCGATECEAAEEARARAASQAQGAAEALRAERRSPGQAEEACRSRKRPRTSPL